MVQGGERSALLAPSPRTSRPVPSPGEVCYALGVAATTGFIAFVQGSSYGLLNMSPYVMSYGGPNAVPMAICTYLVSVVASQVSGSIISSMGFASGGATYEILPMISIMNDALVTAMVSPPAASGSISTTVGLVDSGDPAVPVNPVEILSTCFAAQALVSLCIGTMYLIINKLPGAAEKFRLIPLVALHGALAGIGVFLVSSAVTSTLLQDGSMVLVASLLGGVMVLLRARYEHKPLLVVVLLFVVLVALNVLRITMPTVVPEAWFLSTTTTTTPADAATTATATTAGSTTPALLTFLDLAGPVAWWVRGGAMVRWDVIFTTPATYTTVAGCLFTHYLTALVDLVSVEEATQHPIRLNDEVLALGGGNLLSGLFGSIPNYFQLTNCLVSHTLNKGNRFQRATGILSATTVLGTSLVATELIPFVPRPLIGAYFFWIAWKLLEESLYKAYRDQVTSTDLGVVLTMAMLMLLVGFMEGLAIGVVISCLSFTFQYGKFTRSIRASFGGDVFQANVHRPTLKLEFLKAHGKRIQVVMLQGFLMFASMPEVTSEIDGIMLQCYGEGDDVGGPGVGASSSPPSYLAASSATTSTGDSAPTPHYRKHRHQVLLPKCLILHMKNVCALDYSAAADVLKLRSKLHSAGWELRICCMSSGIRQVLSRRGCLEPMHFHGRAYTPAVSGDFYHALMQAEDALLRAQQELHQEQRISGIVSRTSPAYSEAARRRGAWVPEAIDVLHELIYDYLDELAAPSPSIPASPAAAASTTTRSSTRSDGGSGGGAADTNTAVATAQLIETYLNYFEYRAYVAENVEEGSRSSNDRRNYLHGGRGTLAIAWPEPGIRTILLVLSGRMVASQKQASAAQQEHVIEYLGSGAVVGPLSTLSGVTVGSDARTVRAEGGSRALRLTHASFKRMQRDDPRHAQVLLRAFLGRSAVEYLHQSGLVDLAL